MTDTQLTINIDRGPEYQQSRTRLLQFRVGAISMLLERHQSLSFPERTPSLGNGMSTISLYIILGLWKNKGTHPRACQIHLGHYRKLGERASAKQLHLKVTNLTWFSRDDLKHQHGVGFIVNKNKINRVISCTPVKSSNIRDAAQPITLTTFCMRQLKTMTKMQLKNVMRYLRKL